MINRALRDGPGYTGHVEDAVTGLTYMQQRYYDPVIGRFLSVDPVTANSGTGANFNRYWYANNNPYKFKDPDGRWPEWLNALLGRSMRSDGPRAEMNQQVARVANEQTKPLQNAAAKASEAKTALRERTSVNAKFAASAGTGVQANKSVAGKSSDSVGWVPVGEGAFAGLTVDVKVATFQFHDGKSPISFEASGELGAGGAVGASFCVDPAGEASIVLSFGIGAGEHFEYSPTVNVNLTDGD